MGRDPPAQPTRQEGDHGHEFAGHVLGRFEWAPDLPRSAEVYSEDYPKTIKYARRFLSDVVMAQIEDPANLARFHDDESRLITLLLIRAGDQDRQCPYAGPGLPGLRR